MKVETFSPPKVARKKRTREEIRYDMEREQKRRESFPFPEPSPSMPLPDTDGGTKTHRENLLIENDFRRRNYHRAPFFPIASDAVLSAFRYFWANAHVPDTVLPEDAIRDKFERKQADLTETNEFLTIFCGEDFANERVRHWAYEATMLREIAVNREDHFARNAANRALRQYLDSRQENHRTTLLAAIDYFESEPNDSETFSSEELQQAKTKMEDVETLEAVARQIDDEGSDSSEETALWQNLWNDPVVQRILNQYDMEKKKFVTSILADLDKISTAVDRLEEKYFRSEAGLWKAYAFSKGEELSEDMWQEFDPQYLRASEIDAEIGDVSFIAMTIYAARLLQKMNRRDENNEPTNNIETMTRIWRAKAIFAPFLESSGRSGFSQALLELGDKLTQRFSGNTDQAFQVAEAQELLDSLGGPDQIHQMSYMYMKDIFAGDVVHEPSFAFNDDLNVIVGEGIIAPDENPENDMRYIFRRKTPLSLFKKIKRKNAALDEKIAQAESQEDRQHLESERITIQNAKKKILDLLALTVIPKDREAPGESKRSIAEDAERRLATILANAAERISHSDIFEIVAIETFGQDEKWHSLIQTALENVGFNMELFQPDRDRDWINAKIIFRDPARDVIVELQFATEEQRESNNLNHDSSKAGRKDTPEDLAAKRRWRETRKGLRKSNGLPQDSLGRGARFKERLSSIIGDPFSIALSSLRKTS